MVKPKKKVSRNDFAGTVEKWGGGTIKRKVKTVVDVVNFTSL